MEYAVDHEDLHNVGISLSVALSLSYQIVKIVCWGRDGPVHDCNKCKKFSVY